MIFLNRYHGWFLFVLLGISIEGMAPSFSWGSPDNNQAVIPFAPGERLTYELRWSFIPAGEAVLEVLPMEIIDGAPAYHFRLTVVSNAFVDLFFKVRDTVDSYVDKAVTHSLRYCKQQEEGDTRRYEELTFDWSTNQVCYRNKKKTAYLDLPAGTFDPLSVYYYTRTLAYKSDDLLERTITDGNMCITARARVVKREHIDIASGRYDTYLLEPEMEKIGGVFEKDRDAKIQLWVTADQQHIPVKIASKVSIGSFFGELTATK